MVKSGEDASSMIINAKEKKQPVAKKEAEVEAVETARKSRLETLCLIQFRLAMMR